MNKLYRVLILLVFFGLEIQCASAADTISFNPQTVKMNMDSSQNVQIVMDEVPSGLAGFNITISIDPKIAEITAISFPSWSDPDFRKNSTLPSSFVSIDCTDLRNSVRNNNLNVSFGNITLTGKKAGTADLSITVDSYYDTDKVQGNINRIYPSAIPCKINVLDTVSPVIASVSLNNSTPNTGNPILVTVNATDNVGVSSVKANDISLVQSGNLWSGIITAIEGVHAVNVSAKDAAGNIAWNNSTSYTAVTPDTTSPVIDSVSLNNSTPNTGDLIRINVGATDNVVVTSVEASGSPLTHMSGDIWEGTLTALEGVHSVNVSAKDAAGNTAWNNSTFYTAVTPDTTSPVIDSVSLNNSTPNTDDSIIVTVDTTDNIGVSSVKANDILLSNQGGSTWSGIITAIEGTHTVNVSSLDEVGNVAWNNSTSYTATTPDTEAPKISSVNLNNSTPNTDDSILVTVAATDNFGVSEVKANDILLTNDSGVWSGIITAIEGIHSVNVSAKDGSGNVDWNNSTSYTSVTPIPPQSIREIQSSPGSTWINWTWTNPNDPKFNHTEIYLNDIFQANTAAEYFNATDLQPETNYIIGTRTADIYGNINETWVNASVKTKPLPDVKQHVTDNDQPEIQSVLLFPANTTAGSKIDISANITDNLAVAEVTAGDVRLISIGGSWQGNITAPSSPGKYSLSIEANDAAGNTVNTSVPYSVVRRQGGVKVEVLPIVSKVVGGKSTTVSVKVKNTQNIDDTFKVRINVNGIPAFYQAGTSWFSWTEKTVNLRAKQEVQIPIEVKAPAGNVTGFKLFRVKVNSEKFSVQGSDIGYLVIPRSRYVYK